MNCGNEWFLIYESFFPQPNGPECGKREMLFTISQFQTLREDFPRIEIGLSIAANSHVALPLLAGNLGAAFKSTLRFTVEVSSW